MSESKPLLIQDGTIPSISIQRSKNIGDCVLDGLSLEISAYSEKKCLSQLREVLKILDNNDKKVEQKEKEEAKRLSSAY